MKNTYPGKNSGMEIELEEIAKSTGFKFTLAEIRENIASILAVTIVLLFAVTVLLSLYLLSIDKCSTTIMEYISIVLPSITTLIGVVFGFYFSQSRL